MNKKNKSKHPGTFTGTVDELLEHCSNLDTKELNADLVEVNKIESIEYIKRKFECSDEEAEFIYQEICNAEVQNTVDELVEEGLVEVIGTNEDGEPLFGLTKLGKQIQKELDKNN